MRRPVMRSPLEAVVLRLVCVLLLFLPAQVAYAQPAPEPTPIGPQAEVPLAEALANRAAAARASEGGNDGVPWLPKRDYSLTTTDYIVTAGAAAVTIGSSILPPTSSARWRGGILFDEDARDALRVSSQYGRYFTRDVSDVGISFASTWPFLIDALVTAWWYRGRSDLAYRMAFVAGEAFTIAAALQGVANHFGSRERPYARNCGSIIPEQSVDCERNVRFRSFFSGHATLAFTSAGIICVNHLGLELLGPTFDRVTCVAGYGVAALTAVFRISSDMHYTSDALIGAAVGTLAGLGVPLLHLRRPQAIPAAAGGVDMRLGGVGQGLGLTGTF
jgi:membrane-associated phospholipid phosphatase